MPVRRLIDRVQREMLAEQRLRGIEIEANVDVPDRAFVMGDEESLAAAVASALLGMLPMFDGVVAGRFTLSADVKSGDQLTIELAQTMVAAPAEWHTRAFDPRWTERPGGTAAALAMRAVAVVAERHQGRAGVAPVGRGTRITISIPLGHPARRSWH